MISSNHDKEQNQGKPTVPDLNGKEGMAGLQETQLAVLGTPAKPQPAWGHVLRPTLTN